MNGAAALTVGQAANAAGVSAKTVRLYEAKGLLPPAERTQAGYRLFTDDDVATLRFIRQARALDLSLDEITNILAVRSGGATPCRHVLGLLDRHITDIDRTIADLQQLRRALTQTRATAAPAATGEICGIIEHATRGSPTPQMS